ncbi:Pentafunctional AROM polypeptide [Labeo rohita]|uniref:Pentafunctional AROM polypeptide n=1 Tax=Labeo rohita TaxID=84645 RepID=A0ABQ8MGY6_LABRO|nr:Pentafunctional AROM polypeptide [Labeo rohita]
MHIGMCVRVKGRTCEINLCLILHSPAGFVTQEAASGLGAFASSLKWPPISDGTLVALQMLQSPAHTSPISHIT